MKRTLVISIVTICFATTTIHAAEPKLVLDKTYNTGDGEIGYDVVVDAVGNVYVAGTAYSADGRKLESYILDQARTTFQWSTGNIPSGVLLRSSEYTGGMCAGKDHC